MSHKRTPIKKNQSSADWISIVLAEVSPKALRKL
jgi:hypothetical protein